MTTTSNGSAVDTNAADTDSLTISAKPRHGQQIHHNDTVFTTIKEGLAHILVPTQAPTKLDTKQYQQAQRDKTKQSLPSQTVFYNPIQQFNRDLSVLAIKAYSEHVVAAREEKRARSSKGSKKGGKGDDEREVDADGEQEGGAGGAEQVEGQALAAEHADDIGSTKVMALKSEPTPEEEAKAYVDGARPSKSSKRKAVDEAFVDKREASPTKRVKIEHEAIQHDDEEINHSTGVASLSIGTSNQPGDSQEPPPKSADTFRILDALSATGLRALRYAQEIPAATSITANDLSAGATESIKINVEHNRLCDKIRAITSDARSHMYSLLGSKEPRYDVIDLDPYGTAVPFLDAAIQGLKDGGLLCVTCTDAGVWASAGYPEKTFSLYGGNPMKGRNSHEGGLRLILHAIAATAARYGVAIEPLLSLSIDFYARVFVRVKHSAEQVKFLAGKTMLVYNCDSGCGAWTTQMIGRNTPFQSSKGHKLYKHGMAQAPSSNTHCEHCGTKTHLSGPMWAGPLHNPHFLQRLLDYVPTLDKSVYDTKERVEGMITTALEETTVEDYSQLEESTSEAATHDDHLIPAPPPSAVDRSPFFFISHYLAGIIHCQAPGENAIKGAIRHAGFRAARSHCQPGSVKTDAPWTFIWRVMREWVRQRAPLKEGVLKPTTAGYAIMQKPSQVERDREADVAYTPVDAGNKSSKDAKMRDYETQEVVFDETLGRDKGRRKLMRYQMNPRQDWGPMNRAKR